MIISKKTLKTCLPGIIIGLSGNNPCSFEKAIMLPQKVTDPIRADANVANSKNAIGVSVAVELLNTEPAPLLTNSFVVTRTDAAPPSPLKVATSCGIDVIVVLVASRMPIRLPEIIPANIHPILMVPFAIKVMITAINIPIEAMIFPLTAVLGELRPFKPSIINTAAKRYMNFVAKLKSKVIFSS